MNDVRQLLKTKANIEKAMQRADPLMRLVMQRQLGVVCEELKEIRDELNKLFEPQEVDQLRARVMELEASNKELLEALEAAREFIVDGMAMDFVGMPEDEDVLEVIEKAIRKAKGIDQ